jgi:hypothetical protein
MGDGWARRGASVALLVAALVSGCSTQGAADPARASDVGWGPPGEVSWAAWPVWTDGPAAAGLPDDPCSVLSPDFLRAVGPAVPDEKPGDAARGQSKPGTWVAACSLPRYPVLLGLAWTSSARDLDQDRAACAQAPPSGRITVPGATISCITHDERSMTAVAATEHHAVVLSVPDPSASSAAVAAELTRLWTAWAPTT